MPYGISSPYAVFNEGNAVRSEAKDGRVTWFYREDPSDSVVLSQTPGGTVTRVGMRHVRSNVMHPDTTCESVPVEDSPLAAHVDGGDD